MLVVDVETSGLDPARHAVLSIGAVDFEHPTRQFYAECRVEPGTEIDEAALRCNGFTRENVADPAKPGLSSLCREFYEWCGEAGEKTLAGHNPHFDADMLSAAFARTELKWPFRYRYVDSHSVAYGLFRAAGRQIPLKNGVSHIDNNTVLRFVGLPEEPAPHHALTGATMEAEALYRMWFGERLLGDYDGYPVPVYLRSRQDKKSQ